MEDTSQKDQIEVCQPISRLISPYAFWDVVFYENLYVIVNLHIIREGFKKKLRKVIMITFGGRGGVSKGQ